METQTSKPLTDLERIQQSYSSGSQGSVPAQQPKAAPPQESHKPAQSNMASMLLARA